MQQQVNSIRTKHTKKKTICVFKVFIRCKCKYSVNYFTLHLEVKLKIQKKYSKTLPDGPDHWSYWLKFMGILITTISKM